MANDMKLELHWFGKEKRNKIEPRVLVSDRDKSYLGKSLGRGQTVDNSLIFGDNLLGLKALSSHYFGSLKCVYIDPPYNTGSAFTHYDDGLEHSIWLSLLRDRLELIKDLLCTTGSLWIQLDDNEAQYCKVLLDEIFGRKNFVATVIWKRRASQANLAKHFAPIHDYIFVYAKDINFLSLNKIPLREEYVQQMYRNPDNDPRGPWRTKPLLQGLRSKNPVWELAAPDGRRIKAAWRCSPQTYADYLADKRIYFPEGGQPNIKIFLNESEGQVPSTFWDGPGTNEEASLQIEALFGDKKAFDTPKPEQLIERILTIATSPGDLVLDSFAGSGTTGAVAHKMGRRWIMIEMGEHCHTHIIPRMKKVIDGTDQGGISKAVGWKGGGGFKYYRLAPTLIKKDAWGNEVINPAYNPEMVAEAVCKLEGFTYAPSETEYWRHGQSTENDYIYVTTQALSAEQLERISEEVGPKRSLLICCGAFKVKDPERFANLTLKKLPKAVLDKAEWDRDDYSLKISQLPMAEEEPEEDPVEDSPALKRPAKDKAEAQTSLFEVAEPQAKRRGKGRGKV